MEGRESMTENTAARPNITVLGIGNILLTDEGFGVRVIEKLYEQYEFPENVSILDGGVLGINLLGFIAQAQHLIVVDAVKNKQPPGTLYRLEKHELPERILLKNSLHQTDFLETLTLCQQVSREASKGRRSLRLLAAGYCDIPPFPPGLQRSAEAKEHAMHSPVETLAMWCLQWWCRGESWMPFAVQKRWAHLVYVALDLREDAS